MFVAVDFDGTIVDHVFPEIGQPVPGAIAWLHRFMEAGAGLILWTMRSDGQESGDVLTQAVDYCQGHGIVFVGINENPHQSWSASPKAYAHVYIDDAAAGCPLRDNPRMGGRPFVDWDQVGPAVMAVIDGAGGDGGASAARR